MQRKRVVVTGIGVISPIGIGKEAYWNGLKEGKEGFKPITLFDTSGLKVNIAGEISDFDPKIFLGDKGLRDLDRSTKLLNSAAKLAIDDANLEVDNENTHDIGISIGTTFGSINSISEFDKDSLIEGPRFVNPSRFPNTVINSPASRTAIRFHIKGFNSTISTGMCSALDAIEYAVNFINFNRAKAVLVGAVEEFCIQTFLGFYKLGWLSGLTDDTKPISCPFDRRRDGIIFSEGASIIILEDLQYANKRNANIYAEILGIGSSYDPYRLIKYNPKGWGMKEAMVLALKDAGFIPHDIDYICANANSTKDADLIETNAIKEVFGSWAYEVPISSIKSMIGETFSASGGMAVVASIGALSRGFIPPTVNYLEKDKRCDLDYVPNKARQAKITNVMINTFDPNGANTVLVIGK